MDKEVLTGYSPSVSGTVPRHGLSASISLALAKRDLPIRLIFEGVTYVVEANGQSLVLKRL